MTNQLVTGYKFVKEDMNSANGKAGKWTVGKWKKFKGELELCDSGFHASSTPLDSLKYVLGDRWFIIEARGTIKQDTDKFVAQEMRLIKELPIKLIVVRFSIACAKRVLDKFETLYPKDDRPRKAIEAAEAWLAEPTQANESAAWSAESAAWSAESAAWSAESAAWSARSAESAAWSAESAAWSAWSAARSAARSAESAAWSAESAAWSARSAAWSAESAEIKWQTAKLNRIISECST